MATRGMLAQLYVNLALDTAAFQKGIANVQRRMRRFGNRMKRTGREISAKMGAPLAGIGTLMLKSAGEFEAGMNRVRAVMAPTAEEFERLRDLAAGLGIATQFSASEAADGIEMLARNGLNATQILDGAADATLRLAAASGGDLASAADVVTDLMVNFGLAAGDLGGVVDNVAGTLANSKLGWEDYALAVGQAAGAAGPLGMSLEDMNAALAATASSFASGAEAGTSFKGFLLRLVPQGEKATAVMNELGLEFFDAGGRMKGLEEIAEQLRQAMAGLTEEQRTAALGTLFGQRTIRTALRLAEEGAEGIRKLKAELADVSATEMAEARLEGFFGELKKMTSAIEGLAITIADAGLLQWATEFVQGLTELVRGLAETNPRLLKWGTIVGGLAVVLGPVIFGLGMFATGLGALAPLAAVSLKGLIVFGAAVAGLSAPLLLVIGAIAAVGFAVWYFWDDIKAAFVAARDFVSQPLSDIVAQTKTWLVDRMGDVWDALKGGVLAIRGMFVAVFGEELVRNFEDFHARMFEAVGRFMSAIKDVIGSGFGWIKEKIGSALDWVAEKWDGLAEYLVFGSLVPDMVDAIVDEFSRMGDGVGAAVEDLGAETSSVFRDLAGAITDPLREALRTGELSFRSFKENILGLADRLADQLIDGAFSQIEDALTGLFSKAAGGTGGGGGLGGLFSGILSGLGSALSSILPGFAHGGSFTVGGVGGIDNNVVAFRASRGERVTVEPPGAPAAAPVINVTVNARDARGVREAAGSVAREVARQVMRAERGYV